MVCQWMEAQAAVVPTRRARRGLQQHGKQVRRPLSRDCRHCLQRSSAAVTAFVCSAETKKRLRAALQAGQQTAAQLQFVSATYTALGQLHPAPPHEPLPVACAELTHSFLRYLLVQEPQILALVLTQQSLPEPALQSLFLALPPGHRAPAEVFLCDSLRSHVAATARGPCLWWARASVVFITCFLGEPETEAPALAARLLAEVLSALAQLLICAAAAEPAQVEEAAELLRVCARRAPTVHGSVRAALEAAQAVLEQGAASAGGLEGTGVVAHAVRAAAAACAAQVPVLQRHLHELAAVQLTVPAV